MKILCIIGVIISILISLFYLFILSGAFAIFMSNPPEPITKYGEFPFKLVYELNGETKVIEDVIICEYVGVKSYGTGGKKNEWRKSLKSGGEEIILLDLSQTNDKNRLGRPMLNIFFDYGQAKYYMGEATRDRITQSLERVNYSYKAKNGDTYRDAISAEEAWEKYKIRLISWECAPPIENEFV